MSDLQTEFWRDNLSILASMARHVPYWHCRQRQGNAWWNGYKCLRRNVLRVSREIFLADWHGFCLIKWWLRVGRMLI